MSRHVWTDQEREYIRAHYGKQTSGKIALKLGLRWQQVQGQIALMKLKFNKAI